MGDVGAYFFAIDQNQIYLLSPFPFHCISTLLRFTTNPSTLLIMLSTCRIATRHAALRGSLPKSLATRSASVWANVKQGPPVRLWTHCAMYYS